MSRRKEKQPVSQTEIKAKRIVKVPRREVPAEPVIDVTPVKSAACGLCGESYSSEDWRAVAAWFSAHLQKKHPAELGQLFGVSVAMLTWLISQCYETKPDWNREEATVVMQKELLEILHGKRDPLIDGMS